MKSDAMIPYFKIPGSVTTIGGYAFTWMYAGIDTFAIGGPGEPSQLTTVGTNIIAYNSTTPVNNIIFYGLTDEFVDSLKGKVNAAVSITRVDA